MVSLTSRESAAAPSGTVSGVPLPTSGQADRRPLRLLRHSLERFVRVIEFELENAARHEENLTRLQAAYKNRGELRRELAAASACLQRLRDHLRQLEKLRGAVLESDLNQFEDAVSSHELRARERLHFFSLLYEKSKALRSRPSSPRRSDESSGQGTEASPLQIQAEETIEDEEEMLAAWEQLAEDLEGLEQMMAEFGRQVDAQGEKVDSIGNNIESSGSRVLSSVRNLATASRLKYAIAPLAGAAVGSLVAGPVGFFVGAKMGAAAGLVGGGMVGLAGGSIVKKMHQRHTEIEMQEMEAAVQEEAETERET